jgi:DNA invertase Pin-like site-specific DNA recombinase
MGETQSHYSHLAQLEKIKEDAFLHRNQVVAVYNEDDRGYKNELERPKLGEAIQRVLGKNITGLVIWRADRLARDLRIAYYLIETLRRQKRYVYSVEDKGFGYNFREAINIGMTPTDYLQNTITNNLKILFSEVESVTTFIRTKAGKEAAIKEGRPPYKPPMGYYRVEETGEIAINIEQAMKVEKLFHTFIQTKSYPVTAKKYGITISKLQNILKNPYYTGWFRWKGKLHKGSYTALITEEQYELVQEIIKFKKERKGN